MEWQGLKDGRSKREIQEELDFRQMERANDTELGESVIVDYFLGCVLAPQDLMNFIGWFYSAKELKRYTFKAWRKLGQVNVVGEYYKSLQKRKTKFFQKVRKRGDFARKTIKNAPKLKFLQRCDFCSFSCIFHSFPDFPKVFRRFRLLRESRESLEKPDENRAFHSIGNFLGTSQNPLRLKGGRIFSYNVFFVFLHTSQKIHNEIIDV